VRVIGAHVLDGEIFVLKAEGEELGTKFGEWNKILSKLYETNKINSDLDNGDEEKQLLEGLLIDKKTKIITKMKLLVGAEKGVLEKKRKKKKIQTVLLLKKKKKLNLSKKVRSNAQQDSKKYI